MIFVKYLMRVLPSSIIYAHCDIPCGIYDPKAAQIAAATVLKMVQKLLELHKEAYPYEPHTPEAIEFGNSLVRIICTKEDHAQKCKEELLILWTDYFKAEHLEKFPDLHDKFWKAAKLCSKNKQSVDIGTAEELIKVVDEIAEIFVKSKNNP